MCSQRAVHVKMIQDDREQTDRGVKRRAEWRRRWKSPMIPRDPWPTQQINASLLHCRAANQGMVESSNDPIIHLGLRELIQLYFQVICPENGRSSKSLRQTQHCEWFVCFSANNIDMFSFAITSNF